MNTKELIMSGIADQLEGTGIKTIILQFPTNGEPYIFHTLNEKGEKIKYDIEQKDMNLLKKLFVTKLAKAWNAKNEESQKAEMIILKGYVDKKDFSVFVQTINKEVHQFNY